MNILWLFIKSIVFEYNYPLEKDLLLRFLPFFMSIMCGDYCMGKVFKFSGRGFSTGSLPTILRLKETVFSAVIPLGEWDFESSLPRMF